ncbi:MAG: hypothetical protein ABIJ09_06185 [Pseudomonadota bacterium]
MRRIQATTSEYLVVSCHGLLRTVCLGELRDLVARMTLHDCVEERKSTLAQGMATAPSRVGADDASLNGLAPLVSDGLFLPTQRESRSSLAVEKNAALV